MNKKIFLFGFFLVLMLSMVSAGDYTCRTVNECNSMCVGTPSCVYGTFTDHLYHCTCLDVPQCVPGLSKDYECAGLDAVRYMYCADMYAGYVEKFVDCDVGEECSDGRCSSMPVCLVGSNCVRKTDCGSYREFDSEDDCVDYLGSSDYDWCNVNGLCVEKKGLELCIGKELYKTESLCIGGEQVVTPGECDWLCELKKVAVLGMILTVLSQFWWIILPLFVIFFWGISKIKHGWIVLLVLIGVIVLFVFNVGAGMEFSPSNCDADGRCVKSPATGNEWFGGGDGTAYYTFCDSLDPDYFDYPASIVSNNLDCDTGSLVVTVNSGSVSGNEVCTSFKFVHSESCLLSGTLTYEYDLKSGVSISTGGGVASPGQNDISKPSFKNVEAGVNSIGSAIIGFFTWLLSLIGVAL